MRIVVVSWRDLANPLAGGSEVVIDRFLTEFQARGHQVALVCGGPVGARPYPVHCSGGTLSQYGRAPWLCRRHFADWDLLVDVENGVPFFSPLWWKGRRVCLVHHVHTDQWRMRFGPAVAAVGRWAESSVMPRVYRHETFVAISDSTARALAEIGVDPARVHTVHSGIDLPDGATMARHRSSPEPLFLVVGRLVPHKRVESVLKAWESVRPATGGRLIVVGEGPERSHLQELAGEGVSFTGRVTDEERNRLFAEAWFLVHAAHHEGWGMVIAEAAAFGTPSLALDAAGVRDVIVDGVTGVLAHSTGDLGDQWMALAADPARRLRLGRAARARAETMTWQTATDRLLEIATAEPAGASRRAPEDCAQTPEGRP